MNEFENGLTPQEVDALGKLQKEKVPPPQVERRTLEALREHQLIRQSRFARYQRPLLIGFATAACLAFFSLGFVIGGRWRSTTTTPPSQPEFLLLIRSSAHEKPTTSTDDEIRRIKEYSAWGRTLAQQGLLRDAEKLKDEGQTLNLVQDQLVVKSSPPNIDPDAIGGFFLIQARDYQQAISIARECPHLKYGGAVEIRQIDAIGPQVSTTSR